MFEENNKYNSYNNCVSLSKIIIVIKGWGHLTCKFIIRVQYTFAIQMMPSGTLENQDKL